MAESIINDKGQTIAILSPLDLSDPDGNQNLLCQHMYRHLLESADLVGGFILSYILQRFRKEFPNFNKDDLRFLVSNNPIVPEGRENILLSGIYWGLKGDYYESLHILVPQLECIFRNIAHSVGGLTIKYDVQGVAEVKMLSYTSIDCLKVMKESHRLKEFACFRSEDLIINGDNR